MSEKETKYIASWSGGKDSTVMIDLLLRDKMPLDYIVFLDTLMEFEEMYEYIEKVKDYWQKRYNANIIILKGKITYEQYIDKEIKKGKNKGVKKGFLNAANPFCEIRSFNKMQTIEKFTKKIKNYKTYIGFTTDEKQRCKENGLELYPLIEKYKMNENDCRKYLQEREMENPLYRHFNRTGCRLCPYKSEKDWKNIYENYPKVWSEIKELEKKIHGDKYIKKHFFHNFRTSEDMEKHFNKHPSFKFDEEPLKDCMCKI
jgi:3'-phosphoadenosine 5'-phosphosulfate sulfotransferase (PAPS reductase)/FAD synthetase